MRVIFFGTLDTAITTSIITATAISAAAAAAFTYYNDCCLTKEPVSVNRIAFLCYSFYRRHCARMLL